MQFLTGYDLQTLLASDEPKVCLYLLSDPEIHPLLNSLSCIYIKTQDGEFYSSFTHVDYPTKIIKIWFCEMLLYMT